MQLEMINDTTQLVSDREMIQLREKFVTEFCSNKGWDKNNLELEQILEIRSHSLWINPLMIKS